MSAELIFEEPTPRGVMAEWLSSVRKHPGVWVKWPERCTNSNASLIKQGKAYGAKPGEFEATSRNVSRNGQCDLYVRYVGSAS